MSSTRSGLVVTRILSFSALLSGIEEVNGRMTRRSMSMEISEGGGGVCVRGMGGYEGEGGV